MVQGAVDLCFEEDDGIAVLDFKTDRTENPDDLKLLTASSLQYTPPPAKKYFLKPVKQKIIYSFALSAAVELE